MVCVQDIDLYIHPLLFVLKLKVKKAGHVIGPVARWIVAAVWMSRVPRCKLPHCCGLLPSPDLLETYQTLKGTVVVVTGVCFFCVCVNT